MTGRMRRVTFWLLWTTIFTVPFQNSVLMSGLGTLTRIVGLVATLAAVVAVLHDGRRHRLLDVHVVVWALAAWAAMSLAWSVDVSVTWTYALTFLQIALLVTLLWEFADGPDDVVLLLGAYVAGCWIGSVLLLQEAATAAGATRVSTGGFNENDLGSILALGVPVAWYLALRAQRRWTAAVAAAYLPVGAVALALTGTRGSLPVLAVGLLLIAGTWRHTSAALRLTTLLSGMGTVAAVVLLVPVATLGRLATLPSDLTGGDLTGRTPLWAAARVIVDEHPLAGVGGGASQLLMERLTTPALRPHNTMLSLLAELGAVGLGLFVLVLTLAVLHVLRAPARERAFGLWTLAAVFVALLPVHWEQQKTVWIVLSLVLATAVERREAPAPESREASRQLEGLVQA